MPDPHVADDIRLSVGLELAHMAEELDRFPYAAETANKAWNEALNLINGVHISLDDEGPGLFP